MSNRNQIIPNGLTLEKFVFERVEPVQLNNEYSQCLAAVPTSRFVVGYVERLCFTSRYTYIFIYIFAFFPAVFNVKNFSKSEKMSVQMLVAFMASWRLCLCHCSISILTNLQRCGRLTVLVKSAVNELSDGRPPHEASPRCRKETARRKIP